MLILMEVRFDSTFLAFVTFLLVVLATHLPCSLCLSHKDEMNMHLPQTEEGKKATA
jgi:hypothetical protein